MKYLVVRVKVQICLTTGLEGNEARIWKLHANTTFDTCPIWTCWKQLIMILKGREYRDKRRPVHEKREWVSSGGLWCMGKKRIEAERRGLPELFPILLSTIHLLCEYHISLYQQLCSIIKEEEKRWRYTCPVSVNVNLSPHPLTSLLVLSLFALFFALSIVILWLLLLSSLQTPKCFRTLTGTTG